MKIQYFVNPKTRKCRMLTAPEVLRQKYMDENTKDGFVEVTEDELEAFRDETWKAVDAGWKPEGKVSYDKFMERVKP